MSFIFVQNCPRKVANFGITFKYKHFLIKPILEDDLCNFTDSQYKSLYKTAILFGSLKLNKFVILKLRINEVKQLFKLKAKHFGNHHQGFVI